MNDWPVAPLSAVASIFNGKTPSKAEQRSSGYPVLKIKDVSALGYFRGKFESFTTPELAEKHSAKHLKAGDSLILNAAHNASHVASKMYLAEQAAIGSLITGEWLTIRPEQRQIDARYLHYWLRYAPTRQAIRELINGIHLYPRDVARLEIPVPQLDVQRRIAEVLDRADALRAKRREAIARLDELTQSLFLDMFGDPGTNPKNWPIRTIGELIESARYGTSEKAGASGEIPVLRMGNITTQGRMDFSDLKYLPNTPDDDRYLVYAGDILFNRTNSADLVGKTAMYREPKPMAYAGYLVRARANADSHPEYISAFLNTKYAKHTLRNMCKSIVGMANINARELQNIHIPAPPFRLQSEFAAQISMIEQFRRQELSGVSELDELFASLQQRAFRGEL